MAPKKRKLAPVPVLAPEVVRAMAVNKSRRERRILARRAAREDKRNPPLPVTERDIPAGSLLSKRTLAMIQSGQMKLRARPPIRPKGPRYDAEQKELDRLAMRNQRVLLSVMPKQPSPLKADLERFTGGHL